MGIRVVSKRAGGTTVLPGETVVYIGRPSVLGNPFTMNSEAERIKVVEQYREWLRCEWQKNDVVRNALVALAKRIKEGESIAVQCWCAPLACHGDVIKEAVEGINARAEDAE